MIPTNDQNVIIREFNTGYTDQVIDLIGNSLKELGVIPNTIEPLDDGDLIEIPKIFSGISKFWVCLFDNDVIGTVAIKDLGDGIAKLKRMFVMSEFHGRGIGQALLDTALIYARSQGYQQIKLTTHKNMERAHRFYSKNGFVKIDTVQDMYHFSIDLG